MKSLFNIKLDVVSITSDKITLKGQKEWVDFAESVFNDIKSIGNNAKPNSNKYMNEILMNYFYKSARVSIMRYFFSNGATSDKKLVRAMKDIEFVKGFCTCLLNMNLKK